MMMKQGRRWPPLGVAAVAAAVPVTAGGAAWASGPSYHARTALTASPRPTALPRGAACERMMRHHPETKRLHSQMMRGSPGMARMGREMMGSGAAA